MLIVTEGNYSNKFIEKADERLHEKEEENQEYGGYNKNNMINCRKNSTIIMTDTGGVFIVRTKLYRTNNGKNL